MKTSFLLTLAVSISCYEYASAQESPPSIPSGPVTYVSNPSNLNSSDYIDVGAYTPTAPAPASQAPKSLSHYSKSLENTHVKVDIYKSSYDYFGLVPCKNYDRGGYSGVSGKTYLPGLAFLGNKWKQVIDGEAGWLYGGNLSKNPALGVGYGIAREILPSLWVDAGYGLRHGGLPGYIAKTRGKSSNQLVHDFGFSARLDDGTDTAFFGQFDLQYAFSGLNGWQTSLQAGKRFVFNPRFARMVLQASAGFSASTHYWGSSVSGLDAYFLRMEIYCPEKKFLGAKLVPWIQCSWSSSTRKKINRVVGANIIDKQDVSVGAELRWDF